MWGSRESEWWRKDEECGEFEYKRAEEWVRCYEAASTDVHFLGAEPESESGVSNSIYPSYSTTPLYSMFRCEYNGERERESERGIHTTGASWPTTTAAQQLNPKKTEFDRLPFTLPIHPPSHAESSTSYIHWLCVVRRNK